MKILSLFTFLLLVVAATLLAFTATSVLGDGKDPEDFRCQICRDFANRVVLENESPRTACRPKNDRAAAKALDGCHFMLKESKLISKLFDLRKNNRHAALTDQDIRDVCHIYTTKNAHDDAGFCPPFEDAYGSKNLVRKLHADSAGWDIRVAPPSSWMNPNSVRITVVDNNINGTTNHSSTFLNQFSYNEHLKFYATEKVVHTGTFPVPQTGDHFNVTLGDNEFVLPIKTAKPGQGIRAVIIGDPCFSSEWVHCEWGAKWKILERLTELLNTLAPMKDSLHQFAIVGDNFYDPLLKLAPQFFTQLNAHALGTIFLSTNGNHELEEHGGCHTSKGIDVYGSSYIQYYGQNTYASHFGGPSNPFNFSNGKWSPALRTIPPLENFFTTTSIGNLGYIAFNGANTLEETKHYFEEACKWVDAGVKAKTLEWIIVFSHWSEQNCLCAKDMYAQKVYDLLVTMDGCKEHAARMKWIEGHSHVNKIIRKDVGFRFGGFGMSDAAGANFGIPFIDSYRDKLEIHYFPIADETDDGETKWKALMDCVKSKGGLHQCYSLGETFLSQVQP